MVLSILQDAITSLVRQLKGLPVEGTGSGGRQIKTLYDLVDADYEG